jgi:N-acetylmuramoyl-L-alanine amidase
MARQGDPALASRTEIRHDPRMSHPASFLATLAAACAAAATLVSCQSPAVFPNGGDYTPPGVVRDFIPDGTNGRHVHYPLHPSYITIHSTEAVNGTAQAHASLLKRGAIRAKTKWNTRGYNIWHFTVDDRMAVQHMPLCECGEHADHDGPGNKLSIGIEICEFSSPARQRAAIDRAARLAADLARHYGIPREKIVPHFHWAMRPNGWHKPCPRILLDRGRPGARWSLFLDKVDALR